VAQRGRAIEVEWQLATRNLDAVRRWLAAGAVVAPWTIVPTAAFTLRDAYYDTADWHLYRSGYALRVRRRGAAVEATLKAVRPADGGMARRREISERLPDARLATLLAARGAVGRYVRRRLGAASLCRLFALSTRRRTYSIVVRRRVVAELALDRTVIVPPRGRRPRRLERVEVEVTRGRPSAVAPFVATLRRRRHLPIARCSKFQEGLHAAALAPPRRR
jgi:inorganic triphosphatase YgiF